MPHATIAPSAAEAAVSKKTTAAVAAAAATTTTTVQIFFVEKEHGCTFLQNYLSPYLARNDVHLVDGVKDEVEDPFLLEEVLTVAEGL